MAVKTPEYWKEYELVEQTTAYGNKVMIPKVHLWAWRQQHRAKIEMEEDGTDIQAVVEYNIQALRKRHPRVCDMYATFWEKYTTPSIHNMD